MIWRKYIPRSRTWLKHLDGIDESNKVTKHKRTAGVVNGSYRGNEKHENKTLGLKSQLHLGNGYIKTPITFIRECLCAHNHKRRLYGVPSMQWSAKLTKDAQHRADELALINSSSISKQKLNENENIYVDKIVDPSTSCPRAVEFWYRKSDKVGKHYHSQSDLSRNTGLFNITIETSFHTFDALRATQSRNMVCEKISRISCKSWNAICDWSIDKDLSLPGRNECLFLSFRYRSVSRLSLRRG